MPTDLEKAMALRSAAEFCEDHGSPKIHGCLHKGGGTPWSEDATGWCALGYVYKLVGDIFQIVDCGNIAVAFDNRQYARAANLLRYEARVIEERIPVTPEVPLPQEVPA